LSKTKKTKIL